MTEKADHIFDLEYELIKSYRNYFKENTNLIIDESKALKKVKSINFY